MAGELKTLSAMASPPAQHGKNDSFLKIRGVVFFMIERIQTTQATDR